MATVCMYLVGDNFLEPLLEEIMGHVVIGHMCFTVFFALSMPVWHLTLLTGWSSIYSYIYKFLVPREDAFDGCLSVEVSCNQLLDRLSADLLRTVYGAAESLASQVTDEHRAKGLVYPPFKGIHEISAQLATAVANKAYDLGMSPSPPDVDNSKLKVCIGLPSQS